MPYDGGFVVLVFIHLFRFFPVCVLMVQWRSCRTIQTVVEEVRGRRKAKKGCLKRGNICPFRSERGCEDTDMCRFEAFLFKLRLSQVTSRWVSPPLEIQKDYDNGACKNFKGVIPSFPEINLAFISIKSHSNCDEGRFGWTRLCSAWCCLLKWVKARQRRHTVIWLLDVP